LIQSTEELPPLLAELERRAQAERCKYIELRPMFVTQMTQPHFQISQQFVHHRLDLTPGLEEVFRHFHYDSIKRKVRRAEREGLVVREGTEREAIETFYGLVVRTRRRLGLPPQPLAWYRNIVQCLCNSARIRLAYKGNLAVGGIMTLQHNKTLYYKYCASDAQFHNLGTVPYLLWGAIQDAADSGLTELDLGRSDRADSGLVTFKDHWGATRSELCYWRSPRDAPMPVSDAGMIGELARTVCSHLPNRCLIGLGALLYPHMA
jgi:lipid II:glycine glycyltransferase (peptidoglycan interpeptide bridge formation enzyme)